MEDSTFNGLREKLENLDWPRLFMFKFIVPSEKLNEIVEAIDDTEFSSRSSKNGKYTCITSVQYVPSGEDVIEVYRKASHVEGVIAL